MKPLAVTVNQLTELVPFKRTKIYSLINSGKLDTVLVGRRRLILMSSIENLLRPAVEVEAL